MGYDAKIEKINKLKVERSKDYPYWQNTPCLDRGAGPLDNPLREKWTVVGPTASR